MSEEQTVGVRVASSALLGELAVTAEMLETYAAECFPADEKGRVHFARAMMESAAPALRAADAEIQRLRRIERAARTYYDRYAQDEAADIEDCVCGREQHEDAIELRESLSFSRPNA